MDSTSDIAEFLSSLRAKITPEQVALPWSATQSPADIPASLPSKSIHS